MSFQDEIISVPSEVSLVFIRFRWDEISSRDEIKEKRRVNTSPRMRLNNEQIFFHSEGFT